MYEGRKLVGTSTNERKLASLDIPTRDNIHRYQCNNPILYHYWDNILTQFGEGIY